MSVLTNHLFQLFSALELSQLSGKLSLGGGLFLGGVSIHRHRWTQTDRWTQISKHDTVQGTHRSVPGTPAGDSLPVHPMDISSDGVRPSVPLSRFHPSLLSPPPIVCTLVRLASPTGQLDRHNAPKNPLLRLSLNFSYNDPRAARWGSVSGFPGRKLWSAKPDTTRSRQITTQSRLADKP